MTGLLRTGREIRWCRIGSCGTDIDSDGSTFGGAHEGGKSGVLKVTSTGGKTPTVRYTAPKSKTGRTVKIPATVKINGVSYKVTSIAANAFKNISEDAFSGISADATIKVPKSKYKEYKKLLREKGLSKKVRIKKY